MKVKKIKREINDYTIIRKRLFPQMGRFKKTATFFDFCLARLRHGSIASDYFYYEFYNKSEADRASFMTERRLYHLVRAMNSSGDRSLLNDKARFNTVFNDYLGRAWLDISKASLEDFKDFCQEHPELYIKPKTSRAGRGIRDESAQGREEELFNELKKEEVLVEERIIQGGVYEALNPQTVNTIRVNSIYKDGGVQIISATLRMGRGDSKTDHMGRGGIHAAIDLASGRVSHPGADYDGKKYHKHPISGQEIVGLELPRWQEVLNLVEELAPKLAGINYVGWDLAPCLDRICLIEANVISGGTSQQISDQLGKWNIYKKFIDE